MHYARARDFYHAVERERYLGLLQLVFAQIRRRYRRRCDDDTDERHAVRHAAAQRHLTGLSAYPQLQLRRGKQRARQKDIQAASCRVPPLFVPALGIHRAVPAGLCKDVQLRRRAYWFYRARPAYLLRRALPVWHTDVVPDGFRIDRQRAVLDIGRGRSQVCAAPAAYLYHAGVCSR